MHFGSIAPLLFCFLQHQLWAVPRGARQPDNRTAGPCPCKSLPVAVRHTFDVVRDSGKTGFSTTNAVTHLSSVKVMCYKTNHPGCLPTAGETSPLFLPLVCTRQRGYREHRQRRESHLTGRASSGTLCLQASHRGLQLRDCHLQSLSGLSRQGQTLTSTRRDASTTTSSLQPLHAANAAPVEMCCYRSRFGIEDTLPSSLTDGSTCSKSLPSKGGFRPRKHKLPAAGKNILFSCRPRAQGAQSGHLLSRTSLRSSTNAYDDTHSLDGIIPVIKPKGPSSGDVCLQIAKLRKQHCEQVLKESSRQLMMSRTHTDGVMECTNRMLDNVEGVSSKRRTGVGHGGTLDPAASGVLVLAIGKGTKLLHRFLTGSKGYRAVVKLGVATDTLDASGVTTDTCDWSHVSRGLLRSTIQSFIGKQLQQPPLYSAKRIRGVRMYQIARGVRQLRQPIEVPAVPVFSEQSEPAFNSEVAANSSAPASQRVPTCEVPTVEPTVRLQGSTAAAVPKQIHHESPTQLSQDCQLYVQDATVHRRYFHLKELLKPCQVEIYDARLVEASKYELPFFEMEVYCSKGTYIRQLAADIAARCHTVAHVVELTRVYQAPFHLNDCVPLAQLDVATLRRRLLRIDTLSKLIQKQ